MHIQPAGIVTRHPDIMVNRYGTVLTPIKTMGLGRRAFPGAFKLLYVYPYKARIHWPTNTSGDVFGGINYRFAEETTDYEVSAHTSP